jgi:hypothetical protein
MLSLLALIRAVSRPAAPWPVSTIRLQRQAIHSFRVDDGAWAVFFDLSPRRPATFDLWLNATSGDPARTACRDRFLVFSEGAFALRASAPLVLKIWRIPRNFCSGALYAISADGKLSGELAPALPAEPLCILAHPFAKRYQMSAFVAEPQLFGNVSAQYYIDSFREPFSSCDLGIECLFLHTSPFLLRLSWTAGTRFQCRLHYQTESMAHSDRPCFLGPIPRAATAGEDPTERFVFQCEDKEEQEHNQFVTVLLTVLAFLVVALILHAAGIVNMRVALGCEDETARFEKVKHELRLFNSESTLDSGESAL